MKRIILIVVVAAVALCGCRYDDGGSIPESFWFDSGVTKLERKITVRRGTSQSWFKFAMELPANEEYRRDVFDLADYTWRHVTGESDGPFTSPDAICNSFSKIAEGIYPDDFADHEFGIGATMRGRVLELRPGHLKYRIRSTLEPFGNPAYGYEYIVEWTLGDYTSGTLREISIREVELSPSADWE